MLINSFIIKPSFATDPRARWSIPIAFQEYRQLALREGTLASYSLLRGFLNSMDAHDAFCSDRLD